MPESITPTTEILTKYSVTNGKLLMTAKADLKDKIEVEIGDTKQVDFYPQVKIQRWDNEVNFSARLKETEIGLPAIVFDKDKIIWRKGNIDVEFFDYTEGEGGYKMIPYLKSKPATNEIRFSVNRKGLDFFKQLPLTQKEIDEGVVRPENVVNSFAIYHKTKGGLNDINGKEYKCGKFAHDFRPHFFDANGLEAWGDLDYIWFDEENGERIVTIPQEFLDKAQFPIRSNDTFGYESSGASDYTVASSGFGTPQTTRGGSVFSPAQSGSLDNVKFYGSMGTGSEGETVDTTVWVNEKDSGGVGTHGQIGAHESLDESYSSSDRNQLHTINFSSENITSGINYIINIVGDGSDIPVFGYTRIPGDSTGATSYEEIRTGATSYADSKENPWVYSTTGTIKYSIYATYTPSGITTYTKKTTAKARIKQLGVSKKLQSRGRVKTAGVTKGLTARAKMEFAGTSKLIQIRAKLKSLGTTKKLTGRGRIKTPDLTKKTTARARMKTAGLSKTIQVRAKVKNLGVIRVITSRARILGAEGGKYLQTRAKIKRLGVSKLLQARGRIETADLSAQISARGRMKMTREKQTSARARMEQSDLSGTIQTRGRINSLKSKTLTIRARLYIVDGFHLTSVRANIVDIGKTYLYLPSSGSSENIPVSFEWYIPSNRWGNNLNFQLQIDKSDDTFADLEVEKRSYQDTGFEYWNGSAWVELPVSGVANSYAGNLARFITNLTNGLKYWRVRAFAG